MILIGLAYAVSNGSKAKAVIVRIKKSAETENRNSKEIFFNETIFRGLKNLNDGFDAESIKYFSERDFEIVLNRVEIYGIGITGIEPWHQKRYFDAYIFENYGDDPFDPAWYRKAFAEFKQQNIELMYAATYKMPETI